ncbi:MAG: hypothetical protein Q8L35_02950 [Actinomycetota bacterium]|nr:hypothetical protein [Actinomycetota bacterium]
MIWFKRSLMLFMLISLLTAPSASQAYYYEDYSDAPVLNVFELSPNVTELVMMPDQTRTVSLRFRNMTAKRYGFKITTTSFEGTNDKQIAWRPRYERSWLRPEIRRFKLKSNRAIRFATRIVSPHNPPAGGHYELLFVSNIPKPVRKMKRGSAALKGISRLGAIFYITVPTGRMTSRVKLITFKTDRRFYSRGPVRFNVALRNKGNVHSRLDGNITVVNSLTNSPVGQIKLNGIIVLPNSNKSASFRLPLKRPIGPYRATLWLRDARTGRIITGKTRFYGLPWQAAVWTIAVGLALIGAWSKLKQYRLVKISDLPPDGSGLP